MGDPSTALVTFADLHVQLTLSLSMVDQKSLVTDNIKQSPLTVGTENWEHAASVQNQKELWILATIYSTAADSPPTVEPKFVT